MTNINCALNCIYQKEGKCCYECVSKTIFSSNSSCAYFVQKDDCPKEADLINKLS